MALLAGWAVWCWLIMTKTRLNLAGSPSSSSIIQIDIGAGHWTLELIMKYFLDKTCKKFILRINAKY